MLCIGIGGTWRQDIAFGTRRLVQLLELQLRHRHYWKNMDCSELQPPVAVRCMRELNRDAFRKRVLVPRIVVPAPRVQTVVPLLKTFLLKMVNLKPVRQRRLRQSNEEEAEAAAAADQPLMEVLLHPAAVKSWAELPTVRLEELQVDSSHFGFDELELDYNNWRADEIFKSVLPQDEEGLASYSCIGHIVHLNLRDHLLPYKRLIGEVLCDKLPACRTVVNKAATIDNTYRNFEFELLFGEAQYQVRTKENGVSFEFDFSRVYWNPRLCTEHERLVQLLCAGDVLYDVFAGVGPFSVPAGRKGCHVLANDLNPESFRWLQHNVLLNKCQQRVRTFNKDGRDFILNDIKSDLLKRWADSSESEGAPQYAIHIAMNLPAIAVEFLDSFRGLFEREEAEGKLLFSSPHFNYPVIHVYSFAKGTDTQTLARGLVEQHLGTPLGDNLLGVHFVRNVAPNKDMYRVSFRLTQQILTTPLSTSSEQSRTSAALKRAASSTSESAANEAALSFGDEAAKMKRI